MEGFLEAVAPEWSLKLELGKGSRSVCVCVGVGVGGGGQPFLGKDIDRPGERPLNPSLRCVRGWKLAIPLLQSSRRVQTLSWFRLGKSLPTRSSSKSPRDGILKRVFDIAIVLMYF